MNEYLIAGLSALTGIIGYLFREFQNRVKPFIEILYVNGTVTKGSDKIIIEDEAVFELGKDCVYIDSFEKNMTINEVGEILKQCMYIKDVRKDLNDILLEILESDDSNTILKIFSKLCSIENFDDLITKVIAGDRILPYEAIDKTNGEKIKIFFDEKEYEGTYWIAFPKNTTTIGRKLNTKPLFDKFSNFIDTIKYWDINGLKHYLSNLKEFIELHYQKANQFFPIAEKIINKNSRWIFKISITNLSNKPILIQKKALLYIYGKIYKPIIEECYLLKINKKGKFDDAISPIIIKYGELIEIGFITNKRQIDMENGDAVRELYNKKNSVFRLIININKVGLFRKQRFKTNKAEFIEFEPI